MARKPVVERLSAPSLNPELPEEARSQRGTTTLVVVGVVAAALVLVVPIVVLLGVTHEPSQEVVAHDDPPPVAPRDDHGAVHEGDRDPSQAFTGLDDQAAGHAREVAEQTAAQTLELARQARAADMRRRFRPGRHVTLDSLVPGTGATAPLVLSHTQGGGADTPWSVAGSRWQSMAMPPPTGAPPLVLAPGQDDAEMLRVLPGEPVRLAVHVPSGRGNEVEGILVFFPGYMGSFYLPLDVQTELGAVQGDSVDDAILYFAIRAPVRPFGRGLVTDNTSFAADIQVATVDHQHHVGPPLQRKLEIMPVGTGDVEVTLAMTRATDLDLYVVDPSGGVVYYGNRDTPGGGHLDLDANAACSSNLGVDHEHVFWPPNAAPAGTYTVRVANFESCIHDQRVNFRVTVRACGDLAVLSGHFDGHGVTQSCTSDPGDRPEWCDTIVTFDVPQCGTAGPARDPKFN